MVALRAKTLAVLQHLMERAGSIVGREELREKVWGAEKNQDSPGLIPSATVRPTCVGREQELDGLANWLARARRGGRAICFLAGEPGAGKTTLVVLEMVPGLKGPFADRARADLRRISR